MPGVACVSVDVAGGTQLGMAAAKFKVRGNPVVVIGDSVAPHPPFPPHTTGPVMVEGTANFRVNGIPVSRAGHVASCGHPTSGRGFFRIP